MQPTRFGTGASAVEVPRGILFHEYAYDDEGLCTDANCIIPTGQNHANIQARLRRAAARAHGRRQDRGRDAAGVRDARARVRPVHLVLDALSRRRVRPLTRVRYLIGIGNYYGRDDSIGLRVAEHIGERGSTRGFRAVDLGGNLLDLVHYLDAETEQVLIVDSARMGLAAGDFAFFAPEQVAHQQSARRRQHPRGRPAQGARVRRSDGRRAATRHDSGHRARGAPRRAGTIGCTPASVRRVRGRGARVLRRIRDRALNARRAASTRRPPFSV